MSNKIYLCFSGAKDCTTSLILSGDFDPLKGSKLKGVLLILIFLDSWACDVESGAFVLAEVLKKGATQRPQNQRLTFPPRHL